MRRSLVFYLLLLLLILFLAVVAPRQYWIALVWCVIFLVGVFSVSMGLFYGKRENLRQSWQSQRHQPLGFVLNPDRRPLELLVFAVHYPEVLQNPVVALLSLEEPYFLVRLNAAISEGEEKRRAQVKELEDELSVRLLTGSMMPCIILVIVILSWWYAEIRYV